MRSKSVPPVVWAALAVPVLWTAVLAAGVYESGMNLFQLLERLSAAAHLIFGSLDSVYTALCIGVSYALWGRGGLVLLRQGKPRPGEEYGSARWGSARQLNGKYADKDPANNTLLTRHVAMSLNGRQHGRNLLQIIVGGSGAGKTRYFCKPNIMQVNGSFLVTDPKGEMLRDLAPLLLEEGYVLRVFDLIDPRHSDAFNPFAYIRDAKDVMKLVNNLIQNTTPKNAQQSDPFWERAEVALDTALMLYLLYEAPRRSRILKRCCICWRTAGPARRTRRTAPRWTCCLRRWRTRSRTTSPCGNTISFSRRRARRPAPSFMTAAVPLSAFIIPEIRSIHPMTKWSFPGWESGSRRCLP